MSSRQEFAASRQEYTRKTSKQTIQNIRQGRTGPVQMSFNENQDLPQENNSRMEFAKNANREDWVESSQKIINDEYHQSMKKIQE